MEKNYNFRGENLASLFENHQSKDIEKCPVCGSTKFMLWADCIYTKAHKCEECKLVFMSPQLEKEGLNDYYSNYIGKRRINNLKKMEQRSEQYALDSHVLKKFVNEGKLLDVGCNGGFFLSELGEGFERYGTELDLTAVNYARENYKSFASNIEQGAIEDTNFENEYFDVITMRGVIEHVSDPNESFHHVERLLKKGGYFFVCATPNGESYCADLYREDWNLFHPVQHLWHFSPKNLDIMAARYNLKLIWSETQYLGTPYADPRNDLIKITEKIKNPTDNQISPAFFENMMSLVFKKI